MLDYETLDIMADACIPLLAVLCLTMIAARARAGQWRVAGMQLASLSAGLCLAYGLMFADMHFGFWPLLGMDYSTHTAVALVLVGFMALVINLYPVLWILSFLAYVLLMLYQAYHTLADIVTTALVISLLVLPLYGRFYQLVHTRNKA